MVLFLFRNEESTNNLNNIIPPSDSENNVLNNISTIDQTIISKYALPIIIYIFFRLYSGT